MARANRDMAAIQPDVIQAMGNGDAVGERPKIVIPHMDAFLRIERPFPKKLADEFFFLPIHTQVRVPRTLTLLNRSLNVPKSGIPILMVTSGQTFKGQTFAKMMLR